MLTKIMITRYRVNAVNIDTHSKIGTLGLCIPVIEVKVETIKNTDLYDRYP